MLSGPAALCMHLPCGLDFLFPVSSLISSCIFLVQFLRLFASIWEHYLLNHISFALLHFFLITLFNSWYRVLLLFNILLSSIISKVSCVIHLLCSFLVFAGTCSCNDFSILSLSKFNFYSAEVTSCSISNLFCTDIENCDLIF